MVLRKPLAAVYNRAGGPDRFYRFRKTAAAVSLVSWLPFIGGAYIGARAITDEVASTGAAPLFQTAAHQSGQPAATVAPASPVIGPVTGYSQIGQYALSLGLIGGSYVLGYGAIAYLVMGRRHRRNALLP